MKTLKITSAIVGGVLLAAFTAGANSNPEPRPRNIPSERWIALGANAGFVMNANVSSSAGTLTRPLPNLTAELYVRTENGWQHARVENPVQAIPLTR
jgi:hypothetical protein